MFINWIKYYAREASNVCWHYRKLTTYSAAAKYQQKFSCLSHFQKIIQKVVRIHPLIFFGLIFFDDLRIIFLNNYYDKLCHFNHFFKWCKCNELSIWYRFVKLVCGLPIWTTEQSGYILNQQQWCLRLNALEIGVRKCSEHFCRCYSKQ